MILLVRGATKGATPNCVPQGVIRARHIPPQTDPTVGLLRNTSCSSCVCIILLVSDATKGATSNGVPQVKVILLCIECCNL